MSINTIATVALYFILHGAGVTWLVSSMSVNIEYNTRAILELRQDSSKIAAEIHANQLTLTRIDTSLKSIKDMISLVSESHTNNSK